MDKLPFEDVENPGRHLSFVVFEPASIRVNPSDILAEGEQVKEIFDHLMAQLISKEHTIQDKILHNRLSKIANMLDLLQSYEGVLITRYFDRIWRRYSYISHLGEAFLDLAVHVDYFPEYKDDVTDLMALRFDAGSDDFDMDDDDNDSDDDDDSDDESSNDDND